jgi:hypothetical protein
MAENLDYRQLIDDYLSDNISIENRAVVEHKLATDPEFKNEFELQKNIVNAIRTTRRLELKHRLENVRIPWYQKIPTGWKIAASISIATITALSIYFYINEKPERIEISPDDTVELITPEKVVPQKPSITITENPDEISESPAIPTDEGTEKAIDNKPTARVEKSETHAVSSPDKGEEPVVSESSEEVEVVVPDLMDDFEGAQDLDLDEAAGDNLNKINPVREDMYSKTEVKTLRHKKYDFHYELQEGILTLYGNFEEIPYEILEINSSEGKKLFLYYRDNYYMLVRTDDIAPLNPVTDTELIRELEIVKINK